MQKIALFVLMFLIAAPVFAESAPVYDADSLPPFEQDRERYQSDLPPPPAPSPSTERRAVNQDQAVNQENSGFVPMQSDRDDDSNDDSQKTSPARAAPVASSPAVTTGSIGDRLRKLEQQVANMQSSDKNVKLETMQTQIQTLRSELDQLSHQVQQLQKQQKTAALPTAQKNTDKNAGSTLAANDDDANAASKKATTDVKSGLKTAKTKKTTDQDAEGSDTKQKTANAQPNVQEEQEIYQTAYNLIKAKKYTEAITALKDMLKKYPSGQFASNAHYWLGELYGLSGKNDQALAEFAIVVKDYSESPRVAEAQLKVGLIYAAQSKWSNAKTSLKQVVTHYPGTTSARLASEQLKQIKQAGH